MIAGWLILDDFYQLFKYKNYCEKKAKLKDNSDYECDIRDSLSYEEMDGQFQLGVGKKSTEHEFKPVDILVLPPFKII